MKGKMLCCLFLILCLSGCVSPEKSAEVQTELHVADGFYLNGFGDVVPFDAELYLYPDEQTAQLYNWTQFNEDHAPFTDLVSDDGTVFAKSKSGEWILLPCFDPFSVYCEPVNAPQSFDTGYFTDTLAFLRENSLYDPNQTVFVWYSDPEVLTEGEKQLLTGTVVAILADPSYRNPYVKARPQVLYSTVDLSHCQTEDDTVRTLFDAGFGIPYQLVRHTQDRLRSMAFQYDFETEIPHLTAEPARQTVALDHLQTGAFATLRTDGTVQLSDGLFDSVSAWQDITSLTFGDLKLCGVHTDGTVSVSYATVLSEPMRAEHAETVQWMEHLTDVRELCYVGNVPFVLYRDGTVTFWDGIQEVSANLPEGCYTDLQWVQGSSFDSFLILRSTEGETRIVDSLSVLS